VIVLSFRLRWSIGSVRLIKAVNLVSFFVASSSIRRRLAAVVSRGTVFVAG
jgi:hypothetical protein